MRLRIALIGLALIAAACGGDDDAATDAETTAAPAPVTTAAPETTAAPATTSAPATTAAPVAAGESVAVAGSGLGDILVDGAGNTLYLFVPDAQGPSVCNDGCAEAWPPLVGDVAVGDGADTALLGSVERDDGAVQATYNGWPLYYFASDAVAGDTNGQGVNEVWYVLDAAGEGIGLPETAAAGESVAVAGSGLGDILVDGAGNTLYLFVPDAQGPSVCNDGCAEAWPPLVGDVAVGDGADTALLGSVERDDGAVQATYNGWPLYYFASDAVAGDTNGQGVNEVWYVLDAAGEAITG